MSMNNDHQAREGAETSSQPVDNGRLSGEMTSLRAQFTHLPDEVLEQAAIAQLQDRDEDALRAKYGMPYATSTVLELLEKGQTNNPLAVSAMNAIYRGQRLLGLSPSDYDLVVMPLSGSLLIYDLTSYLREQERLRPMYDQARTYLGMPNSCWTALSPARMRRDNLLRLDAQYARTHS